ncbi:MAG TPA: hypothetical protein VMQ76_13085 [Terracidiphilus sp.]|nr:hypothetical protein [Terracidiphilus sp.]
MTYIEKLQHCENKMFKVAYLKINLGLTLKEVAGRLGIGEKLADYFWQKAKKKIRASFQ